MLDFGLVKELAKPDANLSAADAVVGTPYYLAPENIARPEAVDARTDLYSLGAVAYHLLTGTTVFEGNTMFEICAKHMFEVPLPPSKRAKRDVPEALESLVLGCLAKDAAERPRTAAEFIARLDGADETEVWTERHGKHWWAERGATVVAAARAVRENEASARSPDTIVFGRSVQLGAADFRV